MQYRVKNSKVVHQYIEGETIILNMENGSYYSLLNTGAMVWQLLMQGATIDQITSALLKITDGKISADSFRNFISELENENLISPENSAPMNQNEFDRLLQSYVSACNGVPFTFPTFEKFTDMEGFLLVDPIHDIDESGWPHVKTDD